MSTLQSQLDQVLAFKELARDIHYAIIDDGLAPIDPPGNSAMREAIERVLTPDRLSAIRAAVGGEAA